MNTYLSAIKTIAAEAAELILQVYHSADFETQFKKDAINSPLTKADKLSHTHIVSQLHKLTPHIPVISEEDAASHTTNPPEYWLIDPLDGTKEFIKRNDQFVINIAYMVGQRPLFGLMYVPVTHTCYYTHNGSAYKQVQNNKTQKICVSKNREPQVILVSSSHLDEQTENFAKTYPHAEYTLVGSALKLCALAEGSADIYPRFYGIMDWDIAAGDAILTAAGGTLVDLQGNVMTYGSKDRKNNGFFAYNGVIDLPFQSF